VAAESPAKNDAMERPLTEHRDGDEEEEVFTGSYEPVEYHRVPDSQTQEARQFTHALVEELKQCPREQLPALQKTIWQRQQANCISPGVAGAIWLEAKIQVVKKAPAFLRWALNQVSQITTTQGLAQLGMTMYSHRAAFTSSERKAFWQAYKARKTELQPTGSTP